MSRSRKRRFLAGLALLAVLGAWGCLGAADDVDETPDGGDADRRSLLDFITAGGIVGYVILALSAAGLALVIDAYVHVKAEKLLPPSLIQQAEKLARTGRFSELLHLCQASDSLASRVLGSGLAQGQLGLEAVREAIQESGTREVTRLQQRVGYLGFIAAVAPMLGLLGTVIGMIGSFNVLGAAKGAARPDELAVGISKALVTTCLGLIVAVPLMFFHNYFRDRVTRISQELSGLCERLLRIMTTVIEARAGGGPQPAGRDDDPDDTDSRIEAALNTPDA